MGVILRAFGLETLSEQPLGDYSADVTPPARSTLGSVTVDRALSLPAAFRAIQITAGMAAQLPLTAWRNGQPLTGRDEPAIVRQPDPWRPLSSWIERAVVDLATEGNAFLRKHRGADPYTVAGLEVLDPRRVYVTRSRTGIKGYDYTDPNGKTHKLTGDEVEHVWGLEVPGLDRGLGPIQWCRAALSGVIDVREYAGNWFREQDVPTGILSTDQKLDADTAKAYKRQWMAPDTDEAGNVTRYGPSVKVLGSGLNYSPIFLKPEDAQWLEAQKFGVLDVARMFGIPADYLLAAVDGNSLTYSNLEMIDAQFLRTTLFPVYLRKLEAAITNVLPRGQVARFDTSPLLRPDAKTRAEIDAIYLTHGVVAPGDVRRREGITGPAPARPTPAPVSEETPA